MMHGALISCPAALKGVGVAGDDGFTMADESLARVGGLPVAAAAQSRDCRRCSAAAEDAGRAGFSNDQYS